MCMFYKFTTESSSEARPGCGEILLDMCRRRCSRSCSVKVRFVPSVSRHLLLHSSPRLLPCSPLVLVAPVTPTRSLLCAHQTATSFRAASSVLYLDACCHCPLHRASSVGDPSCALIAPSAWVDVHRSDAVVYGSVDMARGQSRSCWETRSGGYEWLLFLRQQGLATGSWTDTLTLAIACIDEFELTASAAAAIHLHQGTTWLSSNFTFILEPTFFFVLQILTC